MDSINAQQPEHNREDLAGSAAGKRIKDTAETADTCFFCTAVSLGGSSGARPMGIQQADDDGTLWFVSASDSHTNMEIQQQPMVRLFFQGSKHADFMHVTGRAEISRDRAMIRKFWKPLMKVWFTEGEDDPRITIIKVTPHAGYYWDNKHGIAVAGVKMLVGAVAGVTLDDSVEGTLRP